MHSQGNQAGPDTNTEPHRANQDHGQPGIGHSIRPGTTVPDTILAAHMPDGGLLLHGWRDGPTAYLCPSDATALRRELATGFGTLQPARSSNPGDIQ